MKKAVTQKTLDKPDAKKKVLNGHSVAVGGKTVLKKASSKNTNKYAPVKNLNLQEQSGQLTFSYQAADDKSVLAIIDAVRTGISFDAFNNLVRNTPFSLAEWARYLQLSERTIQRNQKEKKAFQPIQSERIVELAMLYEYGMEVFGDRNSLNVWLNSTSIALGGRLPKELLDTKFGVDLVKDELGRIEHGVLA